MLKLILQFWPVLLPLLLYVLWMWRRRVRARKSGEACPAFSDGPWIWAVGATMLGLVAALLFLGLTAEENRNAVYEPKRLIDGDLQRGRLD